MDIRLTILFSGSGSPSRVRINQSAQYLNFLNNCILIDCGEGTQQQLVRLHLSYQKIGTILISHLHADHYGGLFNLLNSMNLNHRQEKLNLYGPPALQTVLNTQMEAGNVKLRFPLMFHEIPDNFNGILFENNSIQLSTFTVDHRIPTHAFIFTEKISKFRINKAAIEGKNIPVGAYRYFLEGNNFTDKQGTVFRAEDYTLAPHPPRKYAYITDTVSDIKLAEKLSGVNLLYHEATFVSRHSSLTDVTGHTSARQAAQLAKKAGVSKLVIGHFSTRYPDVAEVLEEARSVFPETFAATEGFSVSIERDKLPPE